MQRAKHTPRHGFDPYDRRRLAQALRHTSDVRTYRRLQAVLLVARGWSVPEVADLTGARPGAVYAWGRRYRRRHRPDARADAPRSGRPPVALHITDARIVRELRRDPLRLGDSTTGWTVSRLFGVVNPRTGHRLVFRRFRYRQADFQAFLRDLRHHYPGRPIWLFLDRAPAHDAARSRELAARLGIELVWLPKQCSELNAIEHLWKELKRLLAANRPFRTIDDEADYAARWFLGLSPRQALRKAGVLAENFWLKDSL